MKAYLMQYELSENELHLFWDTLYIQSLHSSYMIIQGHHLKINEKFYLFQKAEIV